MRKQITQPDVTNTNPEYWEKVLASHGLGINQPLTDNSDNGESAEIPQIARHSSLTMKQNDMIHLRSLVGPDDRFMEAYEVKKIRGLYNSRTIPDWVHNDTSVREILLRSFPGLNRSENHKNRAGRWARFIHLYYRMALPPQIVMREMDLTLDALEMLVRNIDRASKGLKANGSGRRKK